MGWVQTEEDMTTGSITVRDEYHGNPSAVLNAPDFGYPDVRRDTEGRRWDRGEDGSWNPSLWP